MVEFFFYAIIAFVLLLLPIFISAEGAFSVGRKVVFLRLKLYGIKVITLKIFLDEKEGLLLSINGRKAKGLSKKEKKSKPKRDYLPLLRALYFTNADIAVYAGGEPEGISLFLASLQILLNRALSEGVRFGRMDRYKMRFYPCYVGEPFAVKFSISLFSAPALIFYALAHTTKGVKDAKRSDR